MNILPLFFGHPRRPTIILTLMLSGLLGSLGGCATSPEPIASVTLQFESLATAQPSPQLINQVHLIVPSSPRHCNTRTPWQGGVFTLPSQSLLNPGECFGLEVNVLKKSDVFLFNEDAEGRWLYLPAGGSGYSYDHLSVDVGEWLQFPPHNAFDVGSREERVHVIAIDGTAAVNAMNQLLREQAVCCLAQQIVLVNPIEKLQAFAQQFGTASEWRTLSVRAAQIPSSHPVASWLGL